MFDISDGVGGLGMWVLPQRNFGTIGAELA